MSFYDNSSLAFLPSSGAGKDGKAYSIKPTDGTGDFTFSRGSNLTATRVGPTGLIEKGRENLLLQSNQFDTTWTNNNSTETGGQSGYDGSSDAWLLEKSAVSLAYINQNVSASGVYTISVYAKAGTLDTMNFFISAAKRVQFNLGNGTIDSSSSGVVDSKIEAVSGATGWYRCSATFADATTYVRIYPQWTETTAGSIYIQDAQLELGLAATDYIESGASTGKAGLLEDEPRFDYSGGATCPSLLLEPSRTNLVEQSEYKASSDFTNSTPSYNATSSPEGVQNATEMFDNSTNGQHRVPIGSFAVTSGTDYTISAFVKNNDIGYCYLLLEGSFTQTRYYFNLSTGQPITSGLEVEDFGNSWYRIYVTQSASATGTGSVYLNMSNNGVSPIYTGSSQSLYFYGFQVEQGSYPTSYIPNHSGGTITRGAEKPSISQFQNVFDSSGNYTLFFEIERLSEQTNLQIIYISGPNGYFRLDAQSNGRITYVIYDGISSVTTATSADNQFAAGTASKILYKQEGSVGKCFVNGQQITNTDPSILANNLSVWNENRNHKKHKELYIPEALSDADCITLTTL